MVDYKIRMHICPFCEVGIVYGVEPLVNIRIIADVRFIYEFINIMIVCSESLEKINWKISFFNTRACICFYKTINTRICIIK